MTSKQEVHAPRSWRAMAKEAIHVAVMLPVVLWIFCFGLAGVGTLVLQAIGWLSDGTWPRMGSLPIVAYAGGETTERWATNPQSWLGAHKIIDGVPLCIGLWLVALAPAGILSMLGKGKK